MSEITLQHMHGFCNLCVHQEKAIRELEAELRRCNPILAAAEARAEKAEDALRAVKADRATWRARVAELEAIVEENGLGVKPLSQRGSREAE